MSGKEEKMVTEYHNGDIFTLPNPLFLSDTFIFDTTGKFIKVNYNNKIEEIGKFKIKGVLYKVIGGNFGYACRRGMSCFSSDIGVGYADAIVGFLGCATKEIAMHFGKYFGMLITEAKYGDMVDFEVIEDKYGNY